MVKSAYYIALTACISTALAEVDYTAARSLRREMVRTVNMEQISPIWTPDGSVLFYLYGGEFLQVNTQTGEKKLGIDSDKLTPFFQGKQPRILRFEIDESGDAFCLAATKKKAADPPYFKG